jgi:hypothetical protein
MIQRIQTIWLLITTISSGFLLNGGIVNFIDKTGIKYFTGFSGNHRITGSGSEILSVSIPLALLIVLIPVLSLVTILLFKNRKIQKVFSLILIALSLCLIILVAFYSWLLIKNYQTELVAGFKMAIPIIMLIASILAYRGISNDDRLVKSYDRLR